MECTVQKQSLPASCAGKASRLTGTPLCLRAGTPVQNSMADLFGIMNILDPHTYDDQEEFFELYGREMPTAEQVLALQVGALLMTLLPWSAGL